MEALLRSLAPIAESVHWACNPLEDSQRCITPQEIAAKKRQLSRQKDADQKLTAWVTENTCIACQLFGSPWLASHVQVRDWLVDETFWLGQFQERDGVAIDRDTETASEKKLYSYEVVPAGTVFEGVIMVENAEAWQLGLLMAGLNEFELGSLALGGATSRGLGGVTLEWQWPESRFIERSDLLAYLEDPQAGQSPEALRDEWKSAMLTKLRSMRNGSAEKGGA
jgi:CRISPR-associated RAMP protein (TIGR02581 family)